MTHQSVEGSAAAVPADLVRLSCGIEDAAGSHRRPRPGDSSESVGDRFTWEMRYVLPVILFALLAPAAQAYPKLPNPLPPVKGNPANTLLDTPIEDFRYDSATHCKNARNRRASPSSRTGSVRTPAASSGAPTGARSGASTPPRCTPRTARSTGTWTPSTGPTRRAADKLIRAAAGARQRGQPAGARAPHGRRGADLGLRVLGHRDDASSSPTASATSPMARSASTSTARSAHQDHIHIGMTKAGAKGRTSFWTT